MPVPVEFNSIRRMSTITIPKQDINFDAYDFQMCVPQNDIKDAFESRELEASFCRDFACCGLVLNDLHDLLQHYEECHVCLEDDNESLFESESSSMWSPSLSFSSASSVDGSAPSSPGLSEDSSSCDLDALKKKAAAYLSDLYNVSSSTSAKSGLSTEESSINDDDSISKKSTGKKRSYSQYSGSVPNALDLLTQSAAKKLALVSSLNGNPTPALTDEEFLAQAGALLATASTNSNADKPYKCPINGCDKAYKNPNGLKYHNQHGHCNLLNDDSENAISKPYQCTIGDCGKRYKNLNGLKYHIEHSHMAALNQTLANFGSTLFSPLVSTSNTPSPVLGSTPIFSSVDQNIEISALENLN